MATGNVGVLPKQERLPAVASNSSYVFFSVRFVFLISFLLKLDLDMPLLGFFTFTLQVVYLEPDSFYPALYLLFAHLTP